MFFLHIFSTTTIWKLQTNQFSMYGFNESLHLLLEDEILVVLVGAVPGNKTIGIFEKMMQK